MSIFPFQGSATGDLVKLKARIAPQTVKDVPAVSGFSDFRVWGFPASISPGSIQAQRLNPTRDVLPSLLGKTSFNPYGPWSCGDLDPANPGQENFWMNVLQKYTESNPVGGVTRRIASELGTTSAAPYNTLLMDDNGNFPIRFHTQVIAGITVAANPNGNVSMSVRPSAPNGFDWHGTVTQTAGSGSTLPVAMGTWTGTKTLGFDGEGQWVADGTDRDIYVKVITVVGSTITLKAKYSAAATYDGNAITYVLGTQPGAEIRNQINERFGRVADCVRVYWASGATLVVDDVFKIPARMETAGTEAWSPSYPTEFSMPSPNTKVFVGSDQIKTEGGWQLDVDVDGIQRDDDVFGLQSGSTLKAGQLIATLRITRTITDLTLQKPLHSRGRVNAVVDMELDQNIGATIYPYRKILALANCEVIGSSFVNSDGGKNRQEVVTLRAGLPTVAITYDGITFPLAAFSSLTDNALATL